MAETAASAKTGTRTKSSLQCVVVTPERTVLEKPADFVALPMYDGELGVAHGRTPLTGRLGFGELRVKHGDTVEHFYVEGGFAQVRDDVVTVLTSKGLPVSALDVAVLNKQLEAARQLQGEAYLTAVARAKAQQRLASRQP